MPSSPRDLLQQPHSCTASPGASGSVAVTPWCCSPEADVTEEQSLSHPARLCRLSSRCQGQPCLSADIPTPAPLPRRVFPAVDALPWPGGCWQLCPPWLLLLWRGKVPAQPDGDSSPAGRRTSATPQSPEECPARPPRQGHSVTKAPSSPGSLRLKSEAQSPLKNCKYGPAVARAA